MLTPRIIAGLLRIHPFVISKDIQNPMALTFRVISRQTTTELITITSPRGETTILIRGLLEVERVITLLEPTTMVLAGRFKQDPVAGSIITIVKGTRLMFPRDDNTFN